MKTKLVRPVLVESKETSIGLKIFKEFDGLLSYSGFPSNGSSEQKQLILISLEDEKIEVRDKYLDLLSNKVYTCEGDEYLNHVDEKKVIATQSQLSPEYIQQFIEEYNKGEVKDVEIEMEYHNKPMSDLFLIQKPKLTNGFITIVEKKELITYTEEEIIKALHNLELEHNKNYSHIYEGMKKWLKRNKD